MREASFQGESGLEGQVGGARKEVESPAPPLPGGRRRHHICWWTQRSSEGAELIKFSEVP